MRADGPEGTADGHGARFESVLYPPGDDGRRLRPAADDTLHDLALDQVFARIGEDAPRAAAAFLAPLDAVEAIVYRQGMFRGLDHPQLRAAVEAFLQGMADRARRDSASAGAHSPYEGELWHLSAIVGYLDAVLTLRDRLATLVPELAQGSEAWRLVTRHTDGYCRSEGFTRLRALTATVSGRMERLRYNMLISGSKVTIAPTDDEVSLADAVLETFERFRQGGATDHRTNFRPATFDHVQGWVLERVAQVHPEDFAQLVGYARDTARYVEPVLQRFVDEVRFYLAYLDCLAPIRSTGLAVCFPEVSATSKEIRLVDAWDLALASRLAGEGRTCVTNDLSLTGPERILVISGPNQGGKTTTARLFGQAHHLAAIGCPVPGRVGQLFLCDRVLTVFEREEQLDTLEGRLGAEVQRLREVFEIATARTVIVINEAFASTALHDARILTRDVLERIGALDALGACVTFIDELSRLNEQTVSMVSTVDPRDPAVRTFRVERRTADGRAYARALAAKHGLTEEQIQERMRAFRDARRGAGQDAEATR